MPFVYDLPAINALRQGEILSPVTLHRPIMPSAPLGEGAEARVITVVHNRMVVLHSDCDLEQDFNYRASIGSDAVDESNGRVVSEVLLCDLFAESEIRSQIAGNDIWRRIIQNQNERYHQLPQACISDSAQQLPQLFLDFKRCFMERTPSLYSAIQTSAILRLAIIPDVYIHDLIQRFFSYHARVGLPN